MRSVSALATMLLFAVARPQSGPDIDRIVLEHMQRTKVPGLSVALVKDGKVMFSKGYGLANVEADSAATAETIYRIGSITKTFTATLVMGLVERGQIGLDDKASKYLPNFPASYRDVTIRQLLSHTSGMPNYTALPEFMKLIREAGGSKRILEMAGAAKPDFAPGAGWKYSNTGFSVLGDIVAAVEKRSWADAVRDRITGPLEMTSTRPTDGKMIVRGRAAGYALDKGEVSNADFLDLSWPYAAGALESSVLDLAKWDASLYGKILKPEILATMWTVVVPSTGKPSGYGLGWTVGGGNGIKVVAHGGAIPGFESSLIRVPERKVTVIVLMNAMGGGADPLAKKLVGLLVPELAPKTTAIPDDDLPLTAFLKGRFERFLKGETKVDELTPEFAKIMTPQLIADVSKSLGALGELKRFDLIESQKNGSVVTRSYLVDIGGTVLTATISVTADKKIAGLTVKG